MSPKRGDRVAPPASGDEWDLRFATSEAAKGWEVLCQQAPGNTHRAWSDLRSRPSPCPQVPRNHQLKGSLAAALHAGRELDQWQYEVTGGGRIWYLVDDATHTLWLKAASISHPKATE